MSEAASRPQPARVTLRLFAAAREAAGTGTLELEAASVGDVLDQANRRFGERFAQVLAGCRVWVNGEPATRELALSDRDEVAVLPPVSGGST